MSQLIQIIKHNPRLAHQLDEAISQAMLATGSGYGKSSVSLKIEIEAKELMADARGTQIIDIKPTVSKSLATPGIAAKTYFVDREGHLSQNDPRQVAMEELVNPSQAAREIGKAIG